MTVKQKQNLLAYLGYYVGNIDGIWGVLSKTAMDSFKADFKGLDTPNITENATEKALKHAVAYDLFKTEPAKDETGTFWDEIEYFTREEFRCQCKGKYCNGFPVEPQEKLVRTVNEIRKRLGVPVTIVESGGSGVRCEIHNRNVGGVENSDHKTGNAADLHSNKPPEEMARVAEEVMGNTGQIGIYSWGIHVGINPVYSRFYG
jgi:hypothetical protein